MRRLGARLWAAPALLRHRALLPRIPLAMAHPQTPSYPAFPGIPVRGLAKKVGAQATHSPASIRSAPTAPDSASDDTKKGKKQNGDGGSIIYVMEGVTKQLESGRVLFENVSLSFLHGAKIGVLGVNGAGKSSLLRIIAGVDTNFHGTARALRDCRVGYLDQEPQLDSSLTVEENVLGGEGVRERLQLLKDFEAVAARFSEPLDDQEMVRLVDKQAALQAEIERLGCWDLNRQLQSVLNALRCPPPSTPCINLSGGERRRVALCRLLLSEPDILVLDEPTNHLDASSVAWLEQFLREYKGLVIAVTHDRYFLDKVARWILEVDGGRLYGFKGNYSQWLVGKAERVRQEERRDEKRAKMLAHELEWIRQSPRGRQAKSKARVKNFRLLSEQERFTHRSESGALLFPQGPRLAARAVAARGVGVAVEEPDGSQRRLFSDVNFEVGPGDVLGVVGPNGVGKTTLVQVLLGQRKPTEGEVEMSPSVHVASVAQSRQHLDDDSLVWQEICGPMENIDVGGGHVLSARTYVAQFNFRGTNQQKKVGMLSGGERNRVQLAKALRYGANIIVLDEPTNDLDVDTLRALEESLQTFEGAAIVVSHDRYFLDRICTSILAFEAPQPGSAGPGKVVFFRGNFSSYEAHRRYQLGLPLDRDLFELLESEEVRPSAKIVA